MAFNVVKMTGDSFCAFYQAKDISKEINIQREDDRFYIMVIDLENGSYDYDGSWKPEVSDDIGSAISEALNGSGLAELMMHGKTDEYSE